MKVIFMDIDGTLCGEDGSVPASAKLAIQAVRAQGHKVVLCTGRSKPEIIQPILSIGFDGMIGAGGSYIELDDELLLHKTMDKEDVMAARDYFEEHHIGYYLESNDGLFASENCASSIIDVIGKGNEDANWFLDLLEESLNKEIDYNYINKISFISKDHPYDKVASLFKDRFEMHHTTVAMFGENSGELALKGHTKFTAINTVLSHWGVDKQDTYAFGDGDNDIDMFRAVSCGIAMKNSKPGLLSVADDFTQRAEEDGIFNGFKKIKLI